jgi:hypothetical protein
MTWTRSTWTPGRFARQIKGMGPAGPLIADQQARRRPPAAEPAPGAPLPPHPPAPARASLSAPPRGDHEASAGPLRGPGHGNNPRAASGSGGAGARAGGERVR